tara:strand:- start:178 stop:429 length:252 start_codon:yes stop_codon:yes gene_type:complete
MLLSKAKRKKDGELWSGKWLLIQEIKKDHNTENFYLTATNINSKNNYGDNDRIFKLSEFEEFRFSAFELDNILNKRQPRKGNQ